MKIKRLTAFLVSMAMIIGMMPTIVSANTIVFESEEPVMEETSETKKPESSKPKATEPSKPKETKPAETKASEPSESKETKPAETKASEPAESKETKPAETKAEAPSEPGKTEPSETKATEAAESKDAQPSETKETETSESKETEPSNTKGSEPAESKDTQPAETTETENPESKETEPAATKETEPSESGETEPSESSGDEKTETDKDEGEEYAEGKLPDFISRFSGPSDNDDLFNRYAESKLYPRTITRRRSNSCGDQLSGLTKTMYDQAVKQIKKIANGEQESAYVLIDLSNCSAAESYWSKSQLGVTTIVSGGKITEEAENAVSNEFRKLHNALLNDLPYEMYWHDKTGTGGMGVAGFWYSADNTKGVTSKNPTFLLVFYVASAYAKTPTDVDNTKINKVNHAVNKAKSIVSNAKAKSDYDKLKYYHDQICAMVTYDHDAVDNDRDYGDPWQLISAFDDDPSTDIVCEGYSKAFKYLCDITVFNRNITCLTVSGNCGGGHMWNVVKMPDGKNYLVDVTNDDYGCAGYPDKLFLQGYNYGSYPNYGFTFTQNNGFNRSLTYYYDDDTLAAFTKAELTISNTDYANTSVVVASGKCGDNLNWSLNDEGILTITGSGAMYDWDSTTIPWLSHVSKIKMVVLPNGVTNIGNYAFSGCANLFEISIPSGVTKIGEYAFSGCIGIADIALPANLISVGASAFRGCTGIKSMTIPNGITVIPDGLFYACVNLTEVALSDGVISIGNNAFYNCPNLTGFTMPSGINAVGGGAFYNCSKLSKISFADKNVSIGADAFRGCSGLTFVLIRPGSYSTTAFPNINAGIFHYYYDLTYANDGLGSVSGQNRTYGTDVIELGFVPAAHYEFLKVTWTSGSKTVELKANENGKYVMPDVTSSATSATIKAYFTFSSASGQINENLSWSLDKQGNLVITGTGAMPDWTSANVVPWNEFREYIKVIMISGDITTIGDYAFCNCPGITSVAVSNNVTSIGKNAFANCSGITNVNISKSVTSIKDNAFNNCNAIVSVYYGGTETEWNLINIGTGNDKLVNAPKIYGCYSVTVANTTNGAVKVTPEYAVEGDTVTIDVTPDPGYELDKILVNGNAITGNTFIMGDGNTTVTVTFKLKPLALNETGVAGDYEYKVTNAATNGTGTVTLINVINVNPTVVVPHTVVLNGYTYRVTRIAATAFYRNTLIKSVYIGAFVTVIENKAFYGCSYLVKVYGGLRLQIIGTNAFAYCARLKVFSIASAALKKIGPAAFYKDKLLKTLYLQKTIRLSKAGVKKSLYGSSVKVVKVKKSKVKKYKKYFKKSNSGKKVKVKK